MPVLGLVVVMDDPNERTRQRVANALAEADDLELGVVADHRWPVVLEADSPDQAESRIAALRALPGVAAIDVVYAEGPFKHLENHWRFEPHEEGCLIDFYVDFEFRSKLLQTLIEGLFHEAVKRMVGAFEARAKDLYGEE